MPEKTAKTAAKATGSKTTASKVAAKAPVKAAPPKAAVAAPKAPAKRVSSERAPKQPRLSEAELKSWGWRIPFFIGALMAVVVSSMLLLVSYGVERREAMPLAAVLVAPSVIFRPFVVSSGMSLQEGVVRLDWAPAAAPKASELPICVEPGS